MVGERALVLLLSGCYALLVRGKEALWPKVVLLAGCGCVHVKKVATTTIFYKHVVGASSCSPCFICALVGNADLPCLQHQPGCARKCFDIATCRKKVIPGATLPCMPGQHMPGEPWGVFVGGTGFPDLL